MGRRIGLASTPSSYVASGEWPHGELAADAEPEAHLARGAALRLHQAMESNQWGLRETSRRTGLSTKVLANLLHGHTWPSLPTIARLEMRSGRADLGRRAHVDAAVDQIIIFWAAASPTSGHRTERGREMSAPGGVPFTTIRSQRTAPHRDNPSTSRDPRLSASESAKPHCQDEDSAWIGWPAAGRRAPGQQTPRRHPRLCSAATCVRWGRYRDGGRTSRPPTVALQRTDIARPRRWLTQPRHTAIPRAVLRLRMMRSLLPAALGRRFRPSRSWTCRSGA